MKIANDVLNILQFSLVDEVNNILFLPNIQLERNLYVSVNKCLESIGGEWNRKVKGHIFDHNPSDDLDEMINTGEWTNVKKEYQYFPTPKNIVEKLIELADIQSDDFLLEPSAGEGAIIDLFPSDNEKMAIELMDDNYRTLTNKGYPVLKMDFLDYNNGKKFDKIIMNPPFSKQQDIKHVLHAWDLLEDGGKLVSVVSESPFFRENELSKNFRSWFEKNDGFFVKLPQDAFKESGTMVSTRVIVVSK